jgi:transcriptional regulator GlxA family with amidase domain
MLTALRTSKSPHGSLVEGMSLTFAGRRILHWPRQVAWMGKVEQYCRRNLSRPIGVADMARVAKLSRFHFSRQFASARGVSPGHYLARLRLEEAKRLLAGSDLMVKEIAALCGFADANYLTKVFRRKCGITPGAFRSTRYAWAQKSVLRFS